MRRYKPFFKLTTIPNVIFLPTNAKLKEGETFVFYQKPDYFTAIAVKIRLIEILPPFKKSFIVTKHKDLFDNDTYTKTKIDLRTLFTGLDQPYKAIEEKKGHYCRLYIVALKMLEHKVKK